MSEVIKLKSRIDTVKNAVSIMENQINKLNKKIKSECVLEESQKLEKLYEMKSNAEKNKSNSEFQLSALEEQMVFAIKADAQKEMLVSEKQLQLLLDKYNKFHEAVTVKMNEVLHAATENSVSQSEVRVILSRASKLIGDGATMKKDFHFRSFSKETIESLGLLKNKLMEADALRNVYVNIWS